MPSRANNPVLLHDEHAEQVASGALRTVMSWQRRTEMPYSRFAISSGLNSDMRCAASDARSSASAAARAGDAAPPPTLELHAPSALPLRLASAFETFARPIGRMCGSR
eukprot:366366-Chlamydomonas_euryale.AAC.15